ncbi:MULTISPECIES: hypothetical protein [Methylocaldum]|uniref:hypothetical protein n=1 Tax=unclassified Methylocaldum TaxID=2622260 RepID=UPI00098BC88A|nr:MULTISPECIES: hypothetical protein [unclassified Methylocaldum]MBP1150365.1 hypothetical protein [Methylocaldum sp. RMAD-M]MDV3243223.1 hypothetical protein [Methylocaldum sp.]MVF24087.1 hypothetical protein [Methylocaldum sp. BRCS4]
MMQLLVGLTVIFVVFVIYEVFKTVSRADSTPTPVAAPETKAEEAAGAPAVAETAAPAEEEAAQTERGGQLRNPATGEVSPVPTNYRFAKKWVKEALVAEGLLDRVYKPTELNDAVAGKIKDALDKLKTLDKYRA